MSIDQDIEKILLQEKRLQFKHFDAKRPGQLLGSQDSGGKAKGFRGHRHTAAWDALFAYAMAGITADNWDWIRRKRNVVMRYQRSSYAIGLKYERAKTTLHAATGLELNDSRPTAAVFRFCWRDWMRRHNRFRGCAAGRSCPGRGVLQAYLKLEREDLGLDAGA